VLAFGFAAAFLVVAAAFLVAGAAFFGAAAVLAVVCNLSVRLDDDSFGLTYSLLGSGGGLWLGSCLWSGWLLLVLLDLALSELDWTGSTLWSEESTRLGSLGESLVEALGESGIAQVAEIVVGEDVFLKSLTAGTGPVLELWGTSQQELGGGAMV